MNTDITLALAFATGLLGALHCLGMCGGLAGGFFAQGRQPPALGTQLLYHAGRISMYGLLGVGGALAGQVLAQTGVIGKGQGILMILAGLIILLLGLRLLIPTRPGPSAPTRTSVLVRLTPDRSAPPRPWSALVFGSINGLIPCSLVFSIALKAAATGDPWRAAWLMLAFGLGTLPTMAAVTLTGAWMGARVSGIAMRIAGGLVAILGLWTLYEGYVFYAVMRGLANW
ncbi:MAG: sulfite exporter TauE/SafE family protein [Sphingobacteriia bacterium]|nr:sulfite exporter TauE/SafE family protein [Sphingobacteriia bacterium]NCC40268.1 sulfite exporter TauE/SafE family protein [Gammaproteobacteria bacterium]